MGSAALKLPTAEELYFELLEQLQTLPEPLVGEILEGELCMSPRPAARHATAASTLGMELGYHFHRRSGEEPPGGWWILDEPELHLGFQVLVPDLAGWKRESLPTLPDAAFFTQAPEWVCEVVSPSTERIDRGPKMTRYGTEGVRYLWLVNPVLQFIEVYAIVDGLWQRKSFHEGDVKARLVPFEAIELDLSRLWEMG